MVAKETLPVLTRFLFLGGLLLVGLGFGQFLLIGGLEEIGVLERTNKLGLGLLLMLLVPGGILAILLASVLGVIQVLRKPRRG